MRRVRRRLPQPGRVFGFRPPRSAHGLDHWALRRVYSDAVRRPVRSFRPMTALRPPLGRTAEYYSDAARRPVRILSPDDPRYGSTRWTPAGDLFRPHDGPPQANIRTGATTMAAFRIGSSCLKEIKRGLRPPRRYSEPRVLSPETVRLRRGGRRRPTVLVRAAPENTGGRSAEPAGESAAQEVLCRQRKNGWNAES